jgi:hypothetical protein
MPFAGYPDFAACVADQMKKGYSKGAAQKICGYLEAKAEDKRKKSADQAKKDR